MAGNYHFDQHRREALISSRRFAFINGIIIALLAIGGGYYYFRATHAAGVGGGHHSECEANNPSALFVKPGQQFSAYVQFYNDGSTSWSSGYGMYPGAYPSDSWNSSGPGFPGGAGIAPGGRYSGTFSVTAPSTPGTYPMGWAVWIALTGYLDNVCAPKTITVQNPPVVTLTANGQNSNISVQKGSALTLGWSVTNSPSSCTADLNWSGAKPASGTENRTSDTASLGTKSYKLTCSNGVGSNSVTRSVTVTAPPPPPPPPPGPGPSPSPSPSPGPKPSPSPSPSPGATPPAAQSTPDTSAPTKPDNFNAVLDSDGVAVLLSWNASTDDRGVTGYLLERSLDQQKWDTIADASSLGDTSFPDKSTAFNIHYFYRVRAVDAAGNQSDAATSDITTKAFSANASSGQATSIQSSDGVVAVSIPNDALASDASCSLVDDTSNKSSLAALGQVLAAGPYTLICKDASGNSIDNFNNDVTFSVSSASKRFANLDNIKFYGFDTSSQKWSPLTSTTDKKSKIISATSRQPIEVVVLGTTKKGIPANVIYAIIFVLLIVGLIIFLRIRQIKKQQYADYMRRKYYEL